MRRWLRKTRKSRRGTFVWGRSIPGGIARLSGALVQRQRHPAANEGRGGREGIFVLWAAPPGGVAPPAGEGREFAAAGTRGRQLSPLIRSASAKSLAVRPPAECVDSVSVTLFHWMRMSG
jgi:hypothetical protein